MRNSFYPVRHPEFRPESGRSLPDGRQGSTIKYRWFYLYNIISGNFLEDPSRRFHDRLSG